MQWISCHEGRLLTRADAQAGQPGPGRAFRTGLDALDALAPGGAFARGAVHELLSAPAQGKPLFVAMLLARVAIGAADEGAPATGRDLVRQAPTRSSASKSSGALIWSDPDHKLYPPALAAHGIPLERLYLLRAGLADQVWAVAECLRCKGVGAVVAAMPRLTRIEARRLQLAAEAGGGAGIFLRPATTTGTRGSGDAYAAATRWLVRPAPGERTTQRWELRLLHGHGGRIGHAVTLEYCRENHLVRALPPLAHRPSRPAQPAAGVA